MEARTKPARLAIVGAGAHFTPGLLLGLAAQPGLAGAEVALYDIDLSRLPVVERWGRRLVAERDAAFSVRAVGSLPEALVGADFVFTTIRVGGGEALRADLEVPARHGVEQGVGDTVGPGGLAYALRQVPAFREITRAMEAACPDAWLLNFSNPLTAVCRAVARSSRVRCVGLCDGIVGRRRWLGRYLDVPARELELRHGGLNHLTWITELRHGGEDVYPRLWGRYREAGDGGQPISFRLLEVYGLFPSPGDRHVAEFYPYFHRPGADGGHAYGLQTAAERLVDARRAPAAYWERLTAEADGVQPLPARASGEGEDAMALVAALAGAATSAAAGVFTVNVPNGPALVEGLPPGAVVEGMARADASGLHPLSPVALPAAIAAVLRARADQQELTVEAALTGDRRVALQALATDPLVSSLEQAQAILDELLQEQARWLPQFE